MVDASEINETWTAVAAGWDAGAEFVETFKTPITERLVERLGIATGEQVLDVGAGPGGLGGRLAGLVGGSGRVLVSDLSPAMVAAAQRRLAALDQVEVACLDAVATGLPDGSFDVVLSRMCLMLIPDPAAAVAEFGRLLVDGGRVGAAVWAGVEHNPWLASIGMAAMIHGLVSGGPPTGPGGVFSLGDPDALAATIDSGPFEPVVVDQVAVSLPFTDLDAYMSSVTSMAGPLAAVFGAATDEQRAAVRSTVGDIVEQYRDDDGGYAIPGLANVAVTRRRERTVGRS